MTTRVLWASRRYEGSRASDARLAADSADARLGAARAPLEPTRTATPAGTDRIA